MRSGYGSDLRSPERARDQASADDEAHGLPRPEIQHQVRDRGRLIALVDFAFPEQRVAIEADGYRWRPGRARWSSDLRRRNALTARGWRTVHVTWWDLSGRPDAILEQLRLLLEG